MIDMFVVLNLRTFEEGISAVQLMLRKKYALYTSMRVDFIGVALSEEFPPLDAHLELLETIRQSDASSLVTILSLIG